VDGLKVKTFSFWPTHLN